MLQTFFYYGANRYYTSQKYLLDELGTIEQKQNFLSFINLPFPSGGGEATSTGEILWFFSFIHCKTQAEMCYEQFFITGLMLIVRLKDITLWIQLCSFTYFVFIFWGGGEAPPTGTLRHRREKKAEVRPDVFLLPEEEGRQLPVQQAALQHQGPPRRGLGAPHVPVSPGGGNILQSSARKN